MLPGWPSKAGMDVSEELVEPGCWHWGDRLSWASSDVILNHGLLVLEQLGIALSSLRTCQFVGYLAGLICKM